MPEDVGSDAASCAGRIIWSLWHFQTDTESWGMEDDEQPHLLIGYFLQRQQVEELRSRMSDRSGFRDWPRGFRIGQTRLDGATGMEQGFVDPWDDDAPSADPADVLHLPEPTPSGPVSVVWDVWHFKLRDPAAPIEPLSAKGIGLFSSPANAAAAVAHRRRQPGFRDWPQGFRIFRRRLGVAFGLDGFRERYGWVAWRDSLQGQGRSDLVALPNEDRTP